MLQIGSQIPKTVFQYVELSEHEKNALVCSPPKKLELSGKGKYLLISFPGAFTPTCSQEHLPPFLEKDNLDKVIAKGYQIIFLSANDAFVLQAFAKALGVDKTEAREHVIFASDADCAFSKNFGLTLDLRGLGLGERTARYSMVIVDGVVKYIGNEDGGEVTVSGFELAYKHLE